MSEDELTSLKQRVNELTVSLDAVCKELFETRAKLKTYQEGIPLEDADERQTYLFLHENGSLHKAQFDGDEGGICCWFIGNPSHGFIFLEPSDRLYPLPQEKGGE